MPEGGMGPLLTMSALSEVQACISNFWSGPNRTLPTRRLYDIPLGLTLLPGDGKDGRLSRSVLRLEYYSIHTSEP